jgi:aspartyl-tRNA(Asn)/glutamyl-tRNA(Gln) amidotransferase subunit A
MVEVAYLSAMELRAAYAARQLSPVEVVRMTLERIEELNSTVTAYITVTAELALEQARQAEAQLLRGEDQPLLGIPISLNDLVPTKGIRTTRGSLLFEDWVPTFDAPLVDRLRDAGAIVLGKTNTCEFGWKGDSGNRLVGPTHNPWRIGLTAGGSSGGGAAAVACGLGPIAQGSDGGGSIRIPAAFCGIFGLKPSFGLIAQYPLSSLDSLSHAGPMTRTVLDACLFLNASVGPDARDRHSLNAMGLDYVDAAAAAFTGRVALSVDFGGRQPDPEIARSIRAAAAVFEQLGCTVEEVGPVVDDSLSIVDTYYATANASGHAQNYQEVRDRLDAGRLPLIEQGFRVSGVDLAIAGVRRNEFCEQLRAFMANYDVLLTPTLPIAGFAAGADRPADRPATEISPLGWTPYTYPFNLTGQPAASVPCGFTADGLPIGLQIVGRWRDDVAVLRAARTFEQARPWAGSVPPL